MSTKDELKYLSDVLGVKWVSRPKADAVVSRAVAEVQIMFIGEASEEHKDGQDQSFAGPEGELLTKMISAMGLNRDKVNVTSIVKPEDTTELLQVLEKQIEMINPKIIVALGEFAIQTLLQTEDKISTLRGKIQEWKGRKIIATFHPSYLLRNAEGKKMVWDDLQLVMAELGLKK